MDPEAESVLQGEAQGIVKYVASFLALQDGIEIIDDNREIYHKKAFDVLIFIDKLNIKFVKAGDPRLDQDRDKRNLDILTLIIKNFVKELKHPKGVANMFPAEELAHRIYNGEIK